MSLLPNPSPSTAIVVILLDETGSMMDRLEETIVAYNATLAELSATPSTVIYLQTLKFDRHFEEPISRRLTPESVRVEVAPRLSKTNYTPRGQTPLYDAIGHAIYEADRLKAAHGAVRVSVLIQTDGQENSSREFSFALIQKMIDERKKSGWNILFMGADLKDVGYAMAGSLGIPKSHTMSYTTANSSQAFAASGNVLRSYSVGARSEGFTQEQKKSAGDTSA